MKTKIQNNTYTKTKISKVSPDFERFKSFAQKLVKVPRKDIDEQEKQYQMKKEEKG